MRNKSATGVPNTAQVLLKTWPTPANSFTRVLSHLLLPARLGERDGLCRGVREKLRARPHVDLHRARPAQGGFPHSCRRCAGGRHVVARAAQAPDVCVAPGTGEFLTRESGRRCLYLIDDFASELDDARRGLLASRLKATQSQVFVSAISAEHVMDMSDENSKMFTVEKGKITD